ncbi:MAG TPA: hypothetical protein VE871_16165, partial [Longimicrobium sp.]|nr:hypothetical protein [Longimicrobium sp.]
MAGAVMGLVTMAFHPTGGGHAALALAVHALAIFSAPISFYGGWVLTRRLSAAGPLSELALAFYGLAAVATLLATAASGFLASDLIARVAASQDEARAAAAAVLQYNSASNQAYAKVLVAASSVAIGLWSVEIVRTRSMRRAAGILGCAVAAGTLLLLFSGRLTLDVHGFGAVVLAQAVWSILVGAELRRAGPASTEIHPGPVR